MRFAFFQIATFFKQIPNAINVLILDTLNALGIGRKRIKLKNYSFLCFVYTLHLNNCVYGRDSSVIWVLSFSYPLLATFLEVFS